jgi:hypothetical protein
MKITKKEWEKMKLAGNPERGKKTCIKSRS